MRQYRKFQQYTVLLLVLCLMFGLAACKNEDVISNTYKTLSVTAETYDASMRTAADLYDRGLIDDETKEKIINVGRKYIAAHIVATSTLEAFKQTSMVEDKEKLTTAIGEVTRLIFELTVLMEPYISSDS